jgi:hypothetical protein
MQQTYRAFQIKLLISGEYFFVKDTFVFKFPGSPALFLDEFRKYYGPTMNAFDAAEKNGKADELQKELEDLFNYQNITNVGTSIPATFLRVTITR